MFDWVQNMPLSLKLRENGKMRTQKEERLILLKILMTKILQAILENLSIYVLILNAMNYYS